MKRILFLGACEKCDLVLYVGKLLSKLDKKVLVVDATAGQNYAYWVPKVAEDCLITEFEQMDVATGLITQEALQAYGTARQERIDTYDYLLIDCDMPGAITEWGDIEHHVLVTGLEKRSLLGNVELVKRLFADKDQSLVHFIKVVLQDVDCMIDEDYIEATLADFPIQWTDPSYFVYVDEDDHRLRIENQHDGKLQVKQLSKKFKEAVMDLAQLVSGENERDVKAAMKLAERRK